MGRIVWGFSDEKHCMGWNGGATGQGIRAKRRNISAPAPGHPADQPAAPRITPFLSWDSRAWFHRGSGAAAASALSGRRSTCRRGSFAAHAYT